MADSNKNDSDDPRLKAAREAVESLGQVPAQHATSETVAGYRRAVSLLADTPGKPLWFEAMNGLGAHLLESPHGERGENVATAEQVYRTMLEQATLDGSSEFREWAVLGLANSLMMRPTPTPAVFDEALELYETVADRARQHDDHETLVLVLGNAALLCRHRTDGDVDAHISRAIRLQQEAIQVLSDNPDPSSNPKRARAYHNLGALYLERRDGVHSDNIDRAVRALQSSLECRPADEDPVGRVRTLRALAMAYPEWSGTDSIDEARALANAAALEAEQIESNNELAAQRTSGWAQYMRQRSALTIDLNERLYQLDREERIPWLSQVLDNHQAALNEIPRETMPVKWAEWMAGAARLLGRLPSLGVWDRLDATHEAFSQAASVLEVDREPRVRREVLQRWGEFAHEIGHFERSLEAYGEAADIGDALFETITDPEHRWTELENALKDALFAAYAAARLGRLADAVNRAESQRTRSLADLLDAARVMSDASTETRAAIGAAVDEIHRLENALDELRQRDPGDVATIQRRLADGLGIDPAILKVRRTDAGKDATDPTEAEREQLISDLEEARRSLRHLLSASLSSQASLDRSFGSEEISALAERSKHGLIYLMATAHGGMAVGAFPNGSFDALTLEELKSHEIRALLAGSEDEPGFLRSIMTSEREPLRASLERLRAYLGPAAMQPLSRWLKAKNVDRAVLVPLGMVGLLPLHVVDENETTLSYAPSGRAFEVATHALERGVAGSGVFVVADPTREDETPLPLTIAEARTLSKRGKENAPTLSKIGDEATLDAVERHAAGAAYVHFACHGRFRPSEPLASHLSLAGEDRLTLADVLFGRVDLSKARLVTLSSCQSGNVEFRRASDESLGFPAVLMLGNVPGIVSTMWPVADAVATLFTTKLYELLDAVEPAEAVAQARVWLREARADELQQVVETLRSNLDPSDEATEVALSGLWRGFALRDPADQPYASAPEDWSAFMMTGA